MMTNQEVFEKAVRGVFAQGAFAVIVDEHDMAICKYRHTLNSGKVLKCIAGQLIPDEIYSGAMEGQAIGHVSLGGEWVSQKVDLLQRLQRAHDQAAIGYLRYKSDSERQDGIEHFKATLRRVGTGFELDVAFIADLKWGTEQ